MIKIINYKSYQQIELEEKLNDLSIKGVNLKSNVKIFTKFLKGPRRYYYVRYFLVGSFNKDEEVQQWIDEKSSKDFSYHGQFRKMHIFSHQNDVEFPIDREEQIDYYKRGYLIRCLLIIFLATILSFFFYRSFFDDSVTNYLTNGSIIFHLFLLIGALATVILHIVDIIKARQRAELLVEKKSVKKYQLLPKINNLIFIMVSIGIIFSFGLQSANNDTFLELEDEVVSLADLGYEEESVSSFTTNHSYRIPISYTKLESTDESILLTRYYKFSDINLMSSYLTSIVDNDNLDIKNIDDNVYLIQEGEYEFYNSLLIVLDDELYLINSNFDLENNEIYESLIINY